MKTNHNLFITNHRKKESEISPQEFYSTHKSSVETFLEYAFRGHYINKKNLLIWEPACGKGNISKVLENDGFKVISTDLIDRGFGKGNIDFLNCKKLIDPKVNVIMTNPPFSLATDFVKHAFEISNPDTWIIMYLKLLFLEGKARYKLFKEYPLEYVYIHSSRQGCSPQGETNFKNGGSVAYAWFMWRKWGSFTTEINWLPPN